ncbi:putative hydro-lyase [Cupriavidus sp. UGS-1]|uniref:putative hydro-lyase n=1 Tax=Cupriavidus sp. UGS-1 TaxID=2899826 RepID=UPI001E2DD74D|nr:putative hydro-lyase [Cupriavidus sp. UGS-1]MCD9120725.1 putative hydro-lyase [Cupriavidus sp. UGS-1]
MNLPLQQANGLLPEDPAALRALIRSGRYRGHTSGLARGYVQANIVILSRDWAYDFLQFCALNRKACPLIDVTEPGDPVFRNLGVDVDIRTDVPLYRVYRNGTDYQETTDIASLWRDDFVAFAIGCSFSFEHALLAANVPLKHINLGRNVAMFRTSIETRPAGRLSGKLVVSMRPLKAADAILATEITARYPDVHGAPVHIGDPRLIGIDDIEAPDYGDAVPVDEDEIPVFWACGVTPQAVIREARPEICITHAPGCMLVTDLDNNRL